MVRKKQGTSSVTNPERKQRSCDDPEVKEARTQVPSLVIVKTEPVEWTSEWDGSMNVEAGETEGTACLEQGSSHLTPADGASVLPLSRVKVEPSEVPDTSQGSELKGPGGRGGKSRQGRGGWTALPRRASLRLSQAQDLKPDKGLLDKRLQPIARQSSGRVTRQQHKRDSSPRPDVSRRTRSSLEGSQRGSEGRLRDQRPRSGSLARQTVGEQPQDVHRQGGQPMRRLTRSQQPIRTQSWQQTGGGTKSPQFEPRLKLKRKATSSTLQDLKPDKGLLDKRLQPIARQSRGRVTRRQHKRDSSPRPDVSRRTRSSLEGSQRGSEGRLRSQQPRPGSLARQTVGEQHQDVHSQDTVGGQPMRRQTRSQQPIRTQSWQQTGGGTKSPQFEPRLKQRGLKRKVTSSTLQALFPSATDPVCNLSSLQVTLEQATVLQQQGRHQEALVLYNRLLLTLSTELRYDKATLGVLSGRVVSTRALRHPEEEYKALRLLLPSQVVHFGLEHEESLASLGRMCLVAADLEGEGKKLPWLTLLYFIRSGVALQGTVFCDVVCEVALTLWDKFANKAIEIYDGILRAVKENNFDYPVFKLYGFKIQCLMISGKIQKAANLIMSMNITNYSLNKENYVVFASIYVTACQLSRSHKIKPPLQKWERFLVEQVSQFQVDHEMLLEFVSQIVCKMTSVFGERSEWEVLCLFDVVHAAVAATLGARAPLALRVQQTLARFLWEEAANKRAAWAVFLQVRKRQRRMVGGRPHDEATMASFFQEEFV